MFSNEIVKSVSLFYGSFSVSGCQLVHFIFTAQQHDSIVCLSAALIKTAVGKVCMHAGKHRQTFTTDVLF